MAGDAPEVNWPVEDIPDGAEVFQRAHKAHFSASGELRPGVFRDQQGGMSVDWCKYSTPEESRGRSRKPEDNAIIGLAVGSIRQIDGLRVQHEPLPDNRAHTEVFGEKTEEVRLKLLRIHQPRIPLNAPIGAKTEPRDTRNGND